MDSSQDVRFGLFGACGRLMRGISGRVMNLSPWGYAACMASGLAGWAAGAQPAYARMLATAGFCWLGAFFAMRLIAPAALKSMRQHHQWRDERRAHGMRESAGS